jgi:hypothetical protein
MKSNDIDRYDFRTIRFAVFASLWFILITLLNFTSSQAQPATDAVEVEIHQPTGSGHCPGEVSVFLKNKGPNTVVCAVTFFRGSRMENGGSVTLKPGDRKGGEFGGLWTCGADARVQRTCTVKQSLASAPNCPGYPKPIPDSARACRQAEVPAVVDFYGPNRSCAWCY